MAVKWKPFDASLNRRNGVPPRVAAFQHHMATNPHLPFQHKGAEAPESSFVRADEVVLHPEVLEKE